MKMFIPRRTLLLLTACALLPVPLVQAQDFPNRPIRLVVPYPPGGPTDTVGRLLAQKVSQQLQQQVIVENKPGAGGNVGTLQVARSPADGYALVLSTNGPLAGNLSLVANMPYDPRKDLAPVVLAYYAPSIIAIAPNLGIQSVAELVQAAKAQPNRFGFASAGLGTSSHFAGELFKSKAGVEMVHVPFKGDGPSMMGVVAGEVPIFFGSVSTALPQIQAGKVRALAVTSKNRVPLIPGVPTLAESGLPDFDLGGWYAIMAPAGTPDAILERLNQAFNTALADPEVTARMKSMGGIPMGGPAANVTALIRDDIPKWRSIAESAGIKPN